MFGSEGEEAMGRVVRMFWRGSRIRPETKDEAAEEGWESAWDLRGAGKIGG
jgi:hypothetical protein